MERLLREAEQALARVVVAARGAPFGAAPRIRTGTSLRREPVSAGRRPRPRRARRLRPVLLRPCAAGDSGPGSGDGPGGARHRLRRRPAGRGAQGAAAGRGRGHRARTRRPPRRRGSGSTRSSSATSRSSTCVSARLVRCDRLRRHPRASARARTGCCARPGDWLAPEGGLVASIPNVRHHSVVRSLLQGNWTYESAGLLDRTHLRFFTRREIEKLFFRAGFAIEGMWSVIAPGDDDAMPEPERAGPDWAGCPSTGFRSRMPPSSTRTSIWSAPGRSSCPTSASRRS